VRILRPSASDETGSVLWLTGLSGAGKSTIAAALADRLSERGVRIELIDGDAVRAMLPTGFTPAERDLHVRRVGFLASLLERHGVTVICALISPYAESRDWVRGQCRRFVEIYVSTPLAECERRDVKGLYAAARRGEIRGFTGVDDPYEPPSVPELALDTAGLSVDESVRQILAVWQVKTSGVGRARSRKHPGLAYTAPQRRERSAREELASRSSAPNSDQFSALARESSINVANGTK
jgi:adenylylsulfate kinase